MNLRIMRVTFFQETRKKMTFHEEPDKNEAQDIPNGRRLFRQL